MTYYATIEEDLARAKEILEKGKMGDRDLPAIISPELAATMLAGSGHIYGADNYAAYKLLESCVAEIERLRETLDRLERQARDISTWLGEAGIGPCPIPQGVRELLQRAENAEAELSALRKPTE